MKEVPYPLSHYEIHEILGFSIVIDEKWGSHSSVKIIRGGKALFCVHRCEDYQMYGNKFNQVYVCTGKMRWENI